MTNREGLVKSILKYSMDNRVPLSIACMKFGKAKNYVRDYIYQINKKLVRISPAIQNEVLSMYENRNNKISILKVDKMEKKSDSPFVTNRKTYKKDITFLEPYKNGNLRNTLIIGDTHIPFEKEGYLEFCREMQEKYDCGSVVHIGDLTDNHAISYHDHDPSGKSPGDEFDLALEKCKKWYHTFPDVKVCIGNHDALPFRKLFTAGLPAKWLKSYQEMLESPKTWDWGFIHEVNGVIYQHGTGLSGEMASVNAARENRQSTVIGHLHTVANMRFLASNKDLVFGMSVGCGIDHNKYAFAYGKENIRKPIISCAVVLEGRQPLLLPMNL